MGTFETLAAIKRLTHGEKPVVVTPGVAYMIQHPSHYAQYGREVREFLQENDIPDDFYTGSVLKYLLQYKYSNGTTDVHKALRYCEMLIENKHKCEAADRRRAGLDDPEIPGGLY